MLEIKMVKIDSLEYHYGSPTGNQIWMSYREDLLLPTTGWHWAIQFNGDLNDSIKISNSLEECKRDAEQALKKILDSNNVRII